MSLDSLEQALPAGDRILLDSTSLIAYLSGDEPTSDVAAQIVDRLVESGRNRALVSMVSVMEVLVRPLKADPPRGQHTLRFLRYTPNLGFSPA